MQPSHFKPALKKAVLALTILLLTAGVSFAQSTVSLRAQRQTTVLPDGNSVPMWGWVCGTGPTTGVPAGNGDPAPVAASCKAMNGIAQAGGTTWQPPLITVATGNTLTITLNNSLPVVTSLTIVGQPAQLGGGLGTPVRESTARNHPTQTEATWTTNIPATFTPPAQGQRARSFVLEAAAGGPQTYTWTAPLNPGTYLIETGTYPSIQGPMGLYGVLVVTSAPIQAAAVPPTAFASGTAYPNIKYDADVALLLSEIDPVQNTSVDAIFPGGVAISGFSETTKWTPACGQAHTCYPPAVDYTPLYYMVNGVSFDPTAVTSSAAPIPASFSTGNVLLRFVNAGLRIHAPSVVGLNMSLIAEDGNVLPDVALAASKNNPLTVRVQSNVFLPAGKVYDVMVRPAAVPPALPTAYSARTYSLFDRELSLSANAYRHDSGMQTILQAAGAAITAESTAKAVNDNYIVPVGATTFSANVLNNDIGINNASPTGASGTCAVQTAAQNVTTSSGNAVVLNPNGSFTLTVSHALPSGGDTFQYCGNGKSALFATVTFAPAAVGGAPTAVNDSYDSNNFNKVSSLLRIAAPGVLGNDSDPNGYPLTTSFVSVSSGLSVKLNSDGSFTATLATPPASGTTATTSFQYQAVNSQGTHSNTATVMLTFHGGSGLKVTVQDAQTQVAIGDYKWIIEQDLTFKINPATQVNNGTAVPPTPGTNFHTSHMPVVAVGCTGPQSCERSQTVFDNNMFLPGTTTPNPTFGQHVPAVCDGGICTPVSQLPAGSNPYLPVTTPDQVSLSATNPDGTPASYYISVLPGDSGNSFNTGNVGAPPASCAPGTTPAGVAVSSTCGHTMGGASIAAPVNGVFAPVTVKVEPNPLPTATVTVYVFEDDFPLNGEINAGGGVDALATQEPGLEDFQIVLWDVFGSTGDPSGQMTYDMFNEPLTNSLNGIIDPNTGLDACPISNAQSLAQGSNAIVGVIIVCPRFESDGKTPSPLVGQAVIKGLMPGRFSILAHPGAAREARGEEWVQTNTLDGTHFQDTFIRMGEPAYFQEFGPAGYHVFFGMANPAIINNRKAGLCGGTNPLPCNNTVNGHVTNLHMSRPPVETLFSSGVFPAGDPRNYAPLAYTTCYASLGDSDGATFAFTKCDGNGNFTFTGIPDGNWGLVVFDQWLDMIVDGTSKPVNVSGGVTVDVNYSGFVWQTHIWTRTYLDLGKLGAPVLDASGNLDPLLSPPLIQLPTRVRFRNGKFSNSTLTDINGQAYFNETFPLFNWYVTESDTTRFKGTGVHAVYDAGGQVDGPGPVGNGNAGPYQAILSSKETNPVPANLRVPGAVYCGAGDAQCASSNLSNNPTGGGPGGSTGRIDPGTVTTEGLQGFVSQTAIIDWGKTLYVPGENGGIRGHTVYSSTRPFDDPQMLFQNLWEPLVPGVTVNLYQESTGPDGTQILTLVDTTKSSSWDAWAQGFQADGVTPNMNCPGQDPNDPFFNYTLKNTRHNLNPNIALPNSSQFKCYDGLHVFNQVLPAPYDGLYQFPSPAYIAAHPLSTAQKAAGQTLVSLPPAKYVVEVVPPPGYEIVKEEDKNILIGDNYIAPVTQQFGAISNIFIVPDQASINSLNPSYTGPVTGVFNPLTQNPGNPTPDMGRNSTSGFGPGGLIVQNTPCVGALRVVPDFMSISPESGEVAPFAGASRHLCDRKEVTLEDQMQANAEFYMWTKTPAATVFSGFILDDFSSEFDPLSPQFGEKFAVPNVPISIKDPFGVEISRLYSDQWGIYNGMVYSTWEVNPPNPTGYAPNVMITCMNDPGPVPGLNGTMVTDPFFNPAYSNFCYENPFMPGDTTYLDTPVVPVSAFAEGYNPVDCTYPDATPAIKEVDGDGIGPWVHDDGLPLTITALGDQIVPNPAYSGPAASTAPYNQKFVTRHYGFGSARGKVTIGGLLAPITSWSDSQIVVTVPFPVPSCTLQPAGTPVDLPVQCGELVITAANGKQSVDTVTVTVRGNTPARVLGENAANNAIQSAIDAAAPGDLIIVGPGTYNEMLIMWKPVRLQGVGAASVTVNANTHPSGKIDSWRRQVACLFGLALNGGVINNNLNTSGQPINPYDPTNTFTCSANMQGASDPLPLEAVVGWDVTLNGNLAQLLQEPTLMGAYEGAGITALGKGVHSDPTCLAAGTCIPLTNSAADCAFAGNFLCAPSRIDGMGFTNSSAGGGGIYLHGWNHNMEVSNNRVWANGGTLSGGITVGQAEPGDATFTNGVAPPLMFDSNVHVHHNWVTGNASFGDELNSNTPSAAGGVTICNGSDYYLFDYNWVCGNLSTGDGGGFSHFGFMYNGVVAHNAFLYNQSFNPTITTYGGGAIIQGKLPDNTLCENTTCTTDFDIAPALSDGAGPGTVVDANLFMGNTAESGSGGGLRLQHINGQDVANNPGTPTNWNRVTVTNNIIANNVAGWTGGGVSLQDAVLVDFINNTIVSNDSTASAGVLFDTTGAPNNSVPPPGCDPTLNPPPPACTNASVIASNFQPAGLSTSPHGSNLAKVFTVPSVSCPPGHSNCTTFSNPVLDNNLFWQNRSFRITTGPIPALGLQTIVTLAPSLSQATTGACPNGATNWDLGVYGDTGATNHSSGFTLNPSYSILTSTSGYSSTNRAPSTPGVVSQYCNGSRVPPEIAATLGQSGGIGVPPGVPDVNPFYPAFTLMPSATVDEGNNFINMSYGPLTLSNPTIVSGGRYGVPLGNYGIASGSAAIGAIPTSSPTHHESPYQSKDFFGNLRPTSSARDIGAVEFTSMPGSVLQPPSLAFGAQAMSSTSVPMLATLTNTGNVPLTITSATLTAPNALDFGLGNNCGTSLAVGASCTYSVTFAPGVAAGSLQTAGPRSSNLSVTVTSVGTFTVALSGTGVVPSDSLTPASLTFASQAVGSTSTSQPATLANTGAVALTITNISIGGTNPSNFLEVNTCGPSGANLAPNTTGTLAVGASCTINVSFRPDGTVTSPAATLSVSATGTGAPKTVALSGTAQAPPTSDSLSPASLTFGPQAVGTTSTSQPATLTNTGTVALSVTNISIGGTNPSNFLEVNTCGPGGSNLAPNTTGTLGVGASCTINVSFRPDGTASSPAATLSVSATGTGAPKTVALSGTVQGSSNNTVSLSPTSLSFPSQAVGTTSAAQPVTLSNIGSVTLTITNISLSGTNAADFREGNNCGAGGTKLQPNTTGTLAVGASCTISVRFKPTAAGGETATLNANTNGTGPSTVSLFGNIVAATYSVSWTGSPNPLAFGNQQVNSTSGAQSVTVTNTSGAGGGSLTINAPTTGGTNPSQFGFTNNCPASLPATAGANTCTISVTFAPTSTGAQSATLNVNVGAPATPAQTQVPLSGTGTSAGGGPVTYSVSWAGSPNPLAFGNQAVNTTSGAQSVTVTNTSGAGGGSLTINAPTTGGTNPSQFGFTNNCPASLPATAGANTCTISVRFAPTSTGAQSATLNVNVGAPATPAQTQVPLTGTGTSGGGGGQAVVNISAPSPALTTSPATTTNKLGTVTVSNTGTGPLTITGIAVTQTAGSGQFVITTQGTCTTSTVLAAGGGSCTIVVRYKPLLTTTTSSAFLTITDTGAATTSQNGPSFDGN